jgi:pheromone a factor receptor
MEPVSYPLYPEAVILSVLGGITVILGIPPFIWHLLQRNVAAASLVLWVILLNLTNFINPILWPRDNVPEWWKGQVLCDIEVRLFVGSTVALPGALACIMRKLAKVMDTKNIVMAPSRAQRVGEAVLEILWCFGFPILLMLIYYIVQPIRYFLWGISGCNAAFDDSWPSVVLVMMWSPIVSLVGSYYSGNIP